MAVSASSSAAACWIPGLRPLCSSLEAVSLLIEAIGGLSWHVAVDSFRHVVVQQVLLASLETEVKTRRREVEGWAVAVYVWTVYETACFLRPSCDRAATFEGASDSVLRRRRGGLGSTFCEHAVTSSSSPAVRVETLLKSVEIPQLQFIDVWRFSRSLLAQGSGRVFAAEIFLVVHAEVFKVPPGTGFTRVFRSVNMQRQVPAVLDMPIVVPTSA